MGSFAADQLYVWLAEVPVPEPTAGPAAPPDAPPPAAPADMELAPAQPTPPRRPTSIRPSSPPPARFEIRPVKMLAQGNVHADAKQFQGKTPRLEIWFDHPEDAARAARVRHARWIPRRRKCSPAPLRPTQLPPRIHDKKLELTGDWIRLRLRMADKRPKVNEATVVGNVRLSQTSSVPGDLSLLVTGEMLQLRTDLLDRSAVDVSGTPARVHVQGMLLEGSNLHLSQRENRLWAEGPGG